MRNFHEVSRYHDPSAAIRKIDPKEEYDLPIDEEAEKSIKVEGMNTNELIDMCFQGIDLKTYAGDYFSRSLLANSINSAIETAEQTFDIALTKRTVEDEYHDYEGYDMVDFQYMALHVRPCNEIIKMEYMIGNNKIMDVPLEWIQLDKKAGAITVFPVSGHITPVTPAYGYSIPFFFNKKYVPMGVRISYKAGMDKKDIPANLLEFIYKKASVSIFEVWGDQIIGAGIASSSISADGLSQSIGTTQSAMYGGASARILEYRKDLDELTPIIRRHFARINSVIL